MIGHPEGKGDGGTILEIGPVFEMVRQATAKEHPAQGVQAAKCQEDEEGDQPGTAGIEQRGAEAEHGGEHQTVLDQQGEVAGAVARCLGCQRWDQEHADGRAQQCGYRLIATMTADG